MYPKIWQRRVHGEALGDDVVDGDGCRSGLDVTHFLQCGAQRQRGCKLASHIEHSK